MRAALAGWVVLCLTLGGCGGKDDGTGGGPALRPVAGSPAPEGAGRPTPPREGDPLAEMDTYIAERRITKSAGWRTALPAPIQVGFPKTGHVHWTLETNRGPIVVKLWHEIAPLHVSNQVYLTRLGFYDGLTFHRVIQGFMAQGGCPVGNGSGMPGYGLPLEVSKAVKHDRAGLLSTANTGRPNTDGSQFFLTFRPAPELDMGYTVYGEVVSGMEVVRLLEAAGAPPGGRGGSAPRQKLLIERASVDVR